MLAYQGSLFGSGPPGMSDTVAVERQHLDEHSWIDHAHGWLQGADMLLADLATTLRWRTGCRPMYGRVVDEPRLHAHLDADVVAARPALSDVVDALQRPPRHGLCLPAPLGALGSENAPRATQDEPDLPRCR